MGALRRPHSLPAAYAARALGQAVSPSPPLHQRGALVRRQQSLARRPVRHVSRTGRFAKERDDPQALFLRWFRSGFKACPPETGRKIYENYTKLAKQPRIVPAPAA